MTTGTVRITRSFVATPRDYAPRIARSIVATPRDYAPLIARLVLAGVMFPHGAQHALGWFGGYGFDGTLGWMTETVGFPAPLAALAIGVELVAPLALMVGLGGRLAAAGIFGLMLGAASTHVANGFFMNWFGTMESGVEGYEYHILALGLSAVVMLCGSGTLSLDRVIVRDAGVADGRRHGAAVRRDVAEKTVSA